MLFGKSMVFAVLPETQAIYGFLIAILILIGAGLFGGSLTTGRVAARFGVRAVCVERSEDYCRLGLKMLNEAEQASKGEQLGLFASPQVALRVG